MWCLILVIIIVFLLFYRKEYYGRGGPLGDFLLTEGPLEPPDVLAGEGGYVYEDELP